MNPVVKTSEIISTAISVSRFTKAQTTMPTWTGSSGFSAKGVINGTILGTRRMN